MMERLNAVVALMQTQTLFYSDEFASMNAKYFVTFESDLCLKANRPASLQRLESTTLHRPAPMLTRRVVLGMVTLIYRMRLLKMDAKTLLSNFTTAPT